MFRENIIKLSEVDSTNNYALSLRESPFFKQGLIITAGYQTKGMGQKGDIWESDRDKNLLLSLVIEPNILLSKKFDISKFVSISICEYLNSLGIVSKIKWPNDIMIANDKVAGVLIHHIISANKISYSVIGIGLNVNQVIFNEYSPKAISLKNKLGVDFNLEKTRVDLLHFLKGNLLILKNKKDVEEKYLSYLFMREKVVLFAQKNKRFYGIIKGVTSDGLLIVEIDKIRRIFDLKEIKMLF